MGKYLQQEIELGDVGKVRQRGARSRLGRSPGGSAHRLPGTAGPIPPEANSSHDLVPNVPCGSVHQAKLVLGGAAQSIPAARVGDAALLDLNGRLFRHLQVSLQNHAHLLRVMSSNYG